MAFLHRAFLLLFLHISLLTCSTWAKVLVDMPEIVEVYKGGTAEISCQYNFTKKQPDYVVIQLLVESTSTAEGTNSRTRIYYSDDKTEFFDPDTGYTNRIEVLSEGQHEFWLIIKDVQLSDDRDYFFQIGGRPKGHVEGRTSLRVFAPPEFPMIEGVPSAIPATNEMPLTVALCEVRNGFPKPNITWYRNSLPLMSEPGYVNVLTQDTQQSSGYYDVRSTLEYKVAKEDNNATFSCEVIFLVPGGTRRIMSYSIDISVDYLDPAVVLPRNPDVLKGENVTLTCNAVSSLKPFFVWYKGEKQVGQGNTFHLQDATYDDNAEYICEASVPTLPTLHTNGSVHITVRGEPELIGEEEEEHLEEPIGKMVTLSCKAEGHPLPNISWKINGNQNWHKVERKESEYMIHSTVSVNVSSDISAQCIASNFMATKVKCFSITAISTTAALDTHDRWMIMVVIILCLLLLLGFLGGVIHILYEKGKIPCGRSDQQVIKPHSLWIQGDDVHRSQQRLNQQQLQLLPSPDSREAGNQISMSGLLSSMDDLSISTTLCKSYCLDENNCDETSLTQGKQMISTSYAARHSTSADLQSLASFTHSHTSDDETAMQGARPPSGVTRGSGHFGRERSRIGIKPPTF